MTNNNPINQEQLIKNWRAVLAQLHQCIPQSDIGSNSAPLDACQKDVSLIAVSKTKPVKMIEILAKEGQIDFGENYLQEAIDKIETLSDIQACQHIRWHYIGHIQRNKTRDIAENFDWVHTIERDIIAKRLNEQRPNNLQALNVLIQVNIDEEESKSGCLPNNVNDLVKAVKHYERLNLRGLMIIPAKANTQAFAQTQAIFKDIGQQHPDLTNWDTLSMGMSADMEHAVRHGATMVRVGRAIFGARD